jgi:predicted RNase H-like HicB family nuclease
MPWPTWPHSRIRKITTRTIMALTIEIEQEDDGRWLAEVAELPGVMAYGQSRQEAIDKAQALSLRVLADRLEQGEAVPNMGNVFSVAP